MRSLSIRPNTDIYNNVDHRSKSLFWIMISLFASYNFSNDEGILIRYLIPSFGHLNPLWSLNVYEILPPISIAIVLSPFTL